MCRNPHTHVSSASLRVQLRLSRDAVSARARLRRYAAAQSSSRSSTSASASALAPPATLSCVSTSHDNSTYDNLVSFSSGRRVDNGRQITSRLFTVPWKSI